MDIISKAAAIQQGSKYYFTGLPCKHGHVTKRQVSNSTCYQCLLDKTHQFRQHNPMYHTAYNKKYYMDNKELVQYHSTQYYSRMKTANPQELLRRYSTNSYNYRIRNAPSIHRRERVWRQLNPGIVNANTAIRRARKLHASPSWGDLAAVAEIYTACEHINTASALCGGVDRYVVDHIIPLGGRTVCGLHVASNLRIITAAENATKLNKLQEDLL